MTNIFNNLHCGCNEVSIDNNFKIDIGSTFNLDVIVYENNDLINRYDLTGILALGFVAKDDPFNPVYIISKSIGSGVTIIDAAQGFARVFLDSTDTAILGQFGGIMYFDVTLIDPLSASFVVSTGHIHLVP